MPVVSFYLQLCSFVSESFSCKARKQSSHITLGAKIFFLAVFCSFDFSDNGLLEPGYQIKMNTENS